MDRGQAAALVQFNTFDGPGLPNIPRRWYRACCRCADCCLSRRSPVLPSRSPVRRIPTQSQMLNSRRRAPAEAFGARESILRRDRDRRREKGGVTQRGKTNCSVRHGICWKEHGYLNTAGEQGEQNLKAKLTRAAYCEAISSETHVQQYQSLRKPAGWYTSEKEIVERFCSHRLGTSTIAQLPRYSRPGPRNFERNPRSLSKCRRTTRRHSCGANMVTRQF